MEGDVEMSNLQSNTIMIKWPPKTGKMLEIPEVDQWKWFRSEEAKKRINPAQAGFIDELEKLFE
ncbi:hypothetical protein [Chryseobacterium wanjuense]